MDFNLFYSLNSKCLGSIIVKRYTVSLTVTEEYSLGDLINYRLPNAYRLECTALSWL